MMFSINRSLCSVRSLSNNIFRCLPRVATSHEPPSESKSSDYAVINSSQQSQAIKFNDYNVVKSSSSKVRSQPVPKSVPKLIDVQTGLNHFINECNEQMLLMTVENKHKLFDSNNIATFIQRLQQLNIKRDSNERNHQRCFDFVDYLILKRGHEFDFEHILTMFFQLVSLNGNAKLHTGNYALKGLIQLIKHNVNKYHLKDTNRILIALERDLGCNIREDERIRPLFDALFLLTKFRQSELDRLDAQALAELAYVFSTELDHVYFTNVLTEYIRDELHHDKYSTLLMFRALDRRGYKHNRTLDVCLYFVNENKDMFIEEMDEIKQCLRRLEYDLTED